MASQTGLEIITIHILSNIFRSRGNQTMKFGQLMSNIFLKIFFMRNIFLEKSYTKCGGETSLGPFNKKPNLNISLDRQSEHLSYFQCSMS